MIDINTTVSILNGEVSIFYPFLVLGTTILMYLVGVLIKKSITKIKKEKTPSKHS